MPEERKSVQIIWKDGRVTNANVVCSDDYETFRLSLEFDNQIITKTGHSFFHSLQEIRRELDERKILLNCYGASRNVRPSGMSISMGGGVKAYKLTLGTKPAPSDDIVDIFETGVDLQPVTVAQQEKFFEEWLRSNKLPIPKRN